MFLQITLKKKQQMKNTDNIKSKLGLTQEEIGMLLGIGKGTWSMYDSGLRDLPLSAEKQLIILLSHLQHTKESSLEKQKFLAAEQEKTQGWLKQEHSKLQYKEQLLNRQLLDIESKRTKCFAALELIHSLETKEIEFSFDILKEIKARLTNTLNKYSHCQLQKLQMRKEHLELLKNSLEQKMKENSKNM